MEDLIFMLFCPLPIIEDEKYLVLICSFEYFLFHKLSANTIISVKGLYRNWRDELIKFLLRMPMIPSTVMCRMCNKHKANK